MNKQKAVLARNYDTLELKGPFTSLRKAEENTGVARLKNKGSRYLGLSAGQSCLLAINSYYSMIRLFVFFRMRVQLHENDVASWSSPVILFKT